MKNGKADTIGPNGSARPIQPDWLVVSRPVVAAHDETRWNDNKKPKTTPSTVSESWNDLGKKSKTIKT